MFYCTNRVILRDRRPACRRILHLLAEDVTFFHWTNKNNGDLILKNNCEDQHVHEQYMLCNTMNANPFKDAIEKAILVFNH